MNLFSFGKQNNFEVDGKTILLTGGSDGLGRSVAKILAQKGASIVVVARNVEKLDATITELKAHATRPESQRFHSISSDVSKAGEAIRVVSEVSEWNGGIHPDIVWCLVGASRPTLFLDSTPEQHRQMMDINYWSCADMAHAILEQWLSPKTKESERHLIFTSSVLAFYTVVGYSPYSPTKAAIHSLSDTLLQEIRLYTSSIKVHTIFPGTILTPGYEEENRTKPEITKELEEGYQGDSPDLVAKKSIEGLEKGEYLITTDWKGYVFKAYHLGRFM